MYNAIMQELTEYLDIYYFVFNKYNQNPKLIIRFNIGAPWNFGAYFSQRQQNLSQNLKYNFFFVGDFEFLFQF